MATGVELATAWIRLVPSMDGATAEVTKALDPVETAAEKSGEKSGSKFSKSMGVALLAGAAVVAAGITKVFQTGLEELKFGEEVNAQTDTLVKNTGFKMATADINDYTLALSKVSGISEEDLQVAGNNILKFGDVSEDTYKGAVDALNNMGAAGKDVAGTSEALGKALADPAMAASLLKRQGVMLNDEQKTLIDNFTEAGDKAGAQAVILSALEDTYGGMAEKTGGTLQGNLNKLNNQFENLSGDLVSMVMPAITGLVSGLQVAIDWLSNNQQVIPIFAAAIGVLLVGAFIAWTASIWASTVALLANPVTWVIIGIMALIAAIILLVVNWDTIVAWISDVWSGFISWITGVTDGFVSWWNEMWAGFGSWVGQVWSGFISFISGIWSGFSGWIMGVGNGIASWWNGLWAGIGNFIGVTFRNMVTFVTLYINSVRNVITSIGNTISNIWSGIWNGITSFFTKAWNGIVSTISGIGGAIGRAFGGIASVVQGAFAGVLGAVKGPINGVIALVNKAIGALNSFKVTIPAGVPLIGGQTFGLNIPKIPSLAKGATVLPQAGGTIVRLAEAGRAETVVDTGKVNRLLDQALQGDGGRTHVTVVNKTGTSLEEFVEVIVEKAGKKRRVSLENGLRT